jgi:5-formyltetrahydrofolate cyclo-ligase
MEKPLVTELTHTEIKKKHLREQMHSLGQSLDWGSITTDVLKNLKKHSAKFSRNAIIAAYWPIKGEINILPFLKNWCMQNGVVCLPFVEDSQLPLLFYPWSPQTEMEIGKYQIPTPKQREQNILPDIFLIPFLAFDNKGYRLGRGCGFYDRTLHKLRQLKKIYVIGLGSDHQLVTSIPHENHDEKLDCVITEKKIYIF